MYKIAPLMDAVLKHRRSKEDRKKNQIAAIHKQIQQYIKDGSKGDLDLEGAPITSLPDNLTKVGGSLRLRGSSILELPAGLTSIDGTLSISRTAIESLPDGLVISDHVFANSSDLKELPYNIRVGGSMQLNSTELDSLPNGIEMDKEFSLSLIHTPLAANYSEIQLRQMYPGLRGEIHLGIPEIKPSQK